MQRIEGSGLDRVIRHLRRDRPIAAGLDLPGPARTPHPPAAPRDRHDALGHGPAGRLDGDLGRAAGRRPACRGHGPRHRRRRADAVRAAPRVGLLSLGRQRRPAGGRGAGARPPARGDPPRRQAVEPPGRRPGRRLDGRLRPGPPAGRPEPDPARQPAGHPAVHEPRAGADRADRRPERRLQPGRDPLRAAHAPPAVRGEDGGRADRADRRPRPVAAPRSSTRESRATWRRSS